MINNKTNVFDDDDESEDVLMTDHHIQQPTTKRHSLIQFKATELFNARQYKSLSQSKRNELEMYYPLQYDRYVIILICTFGGMSSFPTLVYLNSHWAKYICDMMRELRHVAMSVAKNAELKYIEYEDQLVYSLPGVESEQYLNIAQQIEMMEDLEDYVEEIEDDEVFEVERVVSKRSATNGDDKDHEYLIKYKGYNYGDSTWEKQENMQCEELLAHFTKVDTINQRKRNNIWNMSRQALVKRGKVESSDDPETYQEFLGRFGSKLATSFQTLDHKKLLLGDRFTFNDIDSDAVKFLVLEHAHRLKKYYEKFKDDIHKFDSADLLPTNTYYRGVKPDDTLVTPRMTGEPQFSKLLEHEMLREIRHRFLIEQHMQHTEEDQQKKQRLEQEMQRFSQFISE